VKLEVLWDQLVVDSHIPATPLGDEWRSNPLGSDGLTAPVIADGRVFVGLPERHQVAALNAADGKELWRFTCEGRLDVPRRSTRGCACWPPVAVRLLPASR